MRPNQDTQIRVYVVEDYALARLGLVSLLKSAPQIEVVGDAGNAQEALSQIKALRPNVVLMDLGLPDMHGTEATRQIKSFDPEIKVIILTSHQEQVEVVSALTAKANAYCMKDIETHRLLEVIKTVYEGATWLDPAIAQITMAFLTHPHPTVEETAHPIESLLTARELQVLHGLIDGKNNADIAQEIFVSVHTVKGDVSHILQKLAVHDRVQAAVKAVQAGLVYKESAPSESNS